LAGKRGRCRKLKCNKKKGNGAEFSQSGDFCDEVAGQSGKPRAGSFHMQREEKRKKMIENPTVDLFSG
jgi:hypothetical protein